jgi:hypothetical protein
MADGVSKKVDEAFTGVDVFSRKLRYHRKNKHIFYDLAHEFANTYCALLYRAGNGAKSVFPTYHFGAEKRSHEIETLGRYTLFRLLHVIVLIPSECCLLHVLITIT